jgi:hypothetical protein
MTLLNDMTYAARVVRTQFLTTRPDARQQLRGLEGEPLLVRIVALSELAGSRGTLKRKLAHMDTARGTLKRKLAHMDTAETTHAGLTALLGRLRVGAPAVGGDALELLMESFTRDVAERMTRALRLTYVVDVCNLSDSDIAGLAVMDNHKRILTRIRDGARETWFRTHGAWSVKWMN